MTEQRKRFADKYFETLHGTNSAIFAGYSESTARQKAVELLRDQEVRDYLADKRAQYEYETGITAKRVLEELAAVAFSSVKNYFMVDNEMMDVLQMGDRDSGAIASVKVYEDKAKGKVTGKTKEIKMHDKMKALDLLGRHLGVFEKDNAQKKADIAIHITSDDADLAQ